MKNKKLLITVTILIAIAILSSITTTAFAFTGYETFDITNLDELFTATNTYTCTSVDEDNHTMSFDLENKRNVQVMDVTQITVLTHGLGGNAGAWSNLYSKDNPYDSFGYDEDSIINKIRERAGDANVYWALMTNHTSFDLVDITDQKSDIYQNNETLRIEHITDISKHIIIVFDAKYASASNDSVYFEFNYMLSKIIYDVMSLNGGILPKVNLIGHSRGGLTNMQYALDHPDIVDSLISFGTPYFGTTTGKLSAITGESAGLTSILDPEIFSNYSKRWNNNYSRLYKNINAVALGGYSSLSFLAEAIWHDASGMLTDKTAAKVAIDAVLGVLYAAKIGLSWSYPAQSLIAAGITEILEMFFPSSYVVSLAEILTQEINIDYHPPFISWYNDICVNLESQLAMSNINIYGGFTYLGFKHRIRFFNNGDGTDFYKVAEKNVPVPHNLEPRDATMIKWAVDELDVGVGRPNGFTYIEKSDGTLSVDGYVGDFMPTTLPIPQKLNNKVVTEIAPYAFEGRLDELEVSEISLPNSILTIGEGAFSNNKLLEKVTLENNSSLNTIQSAAFANCEKLESFTIPQTVTNLGDSVFYGCVSMDSYNVEYGNAKYISSNGVIYSKENNSIGSTLIAYPLGKLDENFVVPSSVTEIYARAFFGSQLQSVDLNNVVYLRDAAFMNSSKLSLINGENVQFADLNALCGTEWLSSELVNNNGCISIGKALYYYNGNENNLQINNYTSISPTAFMANDNIHSVSIGNSLTTIGTYAFYGCKNLEEVYLNNPNNIVFAGTGTFDKNNADRTIFIPACLQQDYEENEVWDQYQLSVHQTTINYNLVGGIIESDKYNTTIGYGDFFALPIPARENYNFVGWYLDENYESELINGTQWLTFDSTLDLYAKWQPKTFTITLVGNGGNVAPVLDYIYGETVALPVPEKTGYEFAGWYTVANFDTAKKVENILPADTYGNFTLYAKWEAKSIKINYDMNATGPGTVQTIATEQTVVFGETYTLPVVSRIGHVFNGWRDANGIFYSNEQGEATFDSWNIEQNITLFADWTRIEYYIKIVDGEAVYWVTDESEFDTVKSPIEYGTVLINPQTLANLFNPDKISRKEGHKFRYFTKNANSSTPISSWEEFDASLTENGYIVSIYAYYEKEINFTINFNYDGAKPIPNINPFVANFDQTINYIEPTKVGYTFQYWKVASIETANTNERFIGTKLAPGTKFDYSRMPDLSIGREEDGVHIWLEAYFKPNTYVITLHSDYGTMATNTVLVDYDSKQNLPILTTTGRTFNGWYVKDSNKTHITDSNGIMLNNWTKAEDTDLYADWSTNIYSVNYVDGYSNSNKVTFTVDNLPYSLTNPYRAGYRFLGWYTTSAYTNRVYSIATIGNKTLYAKWAKLYTVSFNSNGGTYCASKQGITGETIVLPTTTKNGYKGTWSSWGYITGNSSVSNFGYSYTIGTSNVTLTTSWKEKTLSECYNSSNSTYEIWTQNQLSSIRNNLSYNGSEYYVYGNYKIMCDISMSGYWTPVPYLFTGTLDGGNHKLSGFKIYVSSSISSSETRYLGMFKQISGTIKNITFNNISVNVSLAQKLYFGLIAGSMHNNSTISNCHITTTSSNYMTVTNTDYVTVVGSIVGYCYGGNISQCSSSINLTVRNNKSNYVGGLIGIDTSGAVSRCWTEGSINTSSSGASSDMLVGGLIGSSDYAAAVGRIGTIKNCYSTMTVFGDITGKSSYVYAGGLAGVLNKTAVQYCYSTGNVTGKCKYNVSQCGGFVGRIENCVNGAYAHNVFSTGDVYARGNYSGAERKYSYFGRFCGTESNNSLLVLYVNSNSLFKDGKTGTETTWNTSWYKQTTVATLKTVSFQKNTLGLSSSYWNFVEGSYPTLK